MKNNSHLTISKARILFYISPRIASTCASSRAYIYPVIIKYMSKQNLEKILKKELEVLNDQIDEKIIRGLSYAKEARRHKFILTSLSNIRRESRSDSSWLVKPFSTFSII